MKTFTYQKKVRFSHTDPAGIVFYPRYFEMVNETIEEWFSTIGLPFEDMHLEKGLGVPLVHIETDFFRASRLGETLDFTLRVVRIGRSSFDLEIFTSSKGEERFKTAGTLVHIDLKKQKSSPLPDEFRKILLGWFKPNEKEIE